MVISHQSGLPSGRSIIELVYQQGGLSTQLSSTSVVSHQWPSNNGGLLPRLHCTLLSFSPSTHAYSLTHPQLWIVTHSVRSSCASMIMSSACWANSLVLKPSSYFRTFRSSRSDFPFFSSSVYFCFTPCNKKKYLTVVMYCFQIFLSSPSFVHQMEKMLVVNNIFACEVF